MYKDEILEHVRKLWNNWRGDLHRKFVKPAKLMQEALKKVPKMFQKMIGNGLSRSISIAKSS
jgi:hypothetical protein